MSSLKGVQNPLYTALKRWSIYEIIAVFSTISKSNRPLDEIITSDVTRFLLEIQPGDKLKSISKIQALAGAIHYRCLIAKERYRNCALNLKYSPTTWCMMLMKILADMEKISIKMGRQEQYFYQLAQLKSIIITRTRSMIKNGHLSIRWPKCHIIASIDTSTNSSDYWIDAVFYRR